MLEDENFVGKEVVRQKSFIIYWPASVGFKEHLFNEWLESKLCSKVWNGLNATSFWAIAVVV